MPPKTHHTAVVAIPPLEVWEPIQALRRQHDRNVHRWMPHITLLYPFLPQTSFDTALPALLAVGHRLAPMALTFTTVRAFSHARGNATLWLAPEPPAPLVTLQAALQAAFPDYNEQARFHSGFTPHLSIGQTRSPAERQQLLQNLRAAWQPLQCTLHAVALIWRTADGPFQVAHNIPLSGHSA
ncbi:MAG: 2'-5' RNA ligase family protein [Candidatus Tectomicrobia bacterium]|uniref:2'-5' RNA ligase family protein n=1 Tax=Tectimicrobiota bacterium TaxID=2528274 RepID=A0A937W3X1_UNCTE|nr:2'-5' RNA ligase family protein [Candidatus Tectomicrobia bacterium]